MSKYLNSEMGKVEHKLEAGEEKGKGDHRRKSVWRGIQGKEEKTVKNIKEEVQNKQKEKKEMKKDIGKRRVKNVKDEKKKTEKKKGTDMEEDGWEGSWMKWETEEQVLSTK